MNRSAARRTTPKRNPTTKKTLDQKDFFCANYMAWADWSGNIPPFKNDFCNCRVMSNRYNYWGDFNADILGWPTDDSWQLVIQDNRNYPSVTTPLGIEWAVGALAPGRWDNGDIIKCKVTTRLSTDPFPVTPSWGCDIVNKVQTGTSWTFDLLSYGNSMGLIGASGSLGFTNFIMATKENTIEQIEADPNDIWNQSYIDYFKNFTGLRFMQALNTIAEFNTAYIWRRAVWSLTPKRSNVPGVQLNPGVKNYVNGGSGMAVWCQDEGGNQVFYPPWELWIDLCNRLKREPGSKFKKVWWNIPHEVSLAWNIQARYGKVLNPLTLMMVDSSTPIATSAPGFTGFGQEYISNMADLLATTLDPTLQVVFEMSNETWNWSYWQAISFNAQGTAIQNNDAPYYISYDGITDTNVKKARIMAYYATQMSNITKARFALQPNRPMCEAVLCGQLSGIDISLETNVHYVEALTGKEFNKTFDSISVAAYIGPQPTEFTQDNIDATTYINCDKTIYLDNRAEVFPAPVRTGGFNDQGLQYMTELARALNVTHVCYEMGYDSYYVPTNLQYLVVALMMNPDKFRPMIKYYVDMLANAGLDQIWWFHSGPSYCQFVTQYNFQMNYPGSVADQRNMPLSPMMQQLRSNDTLNFIPSANSIISRARNHFPSVIGQKANTSSLYTCRWSDDRGDPMRAQYGGYYNNYYWKFSDNWPDASIYEPNYPAAYAGEHSLWTRNPIYYYSFYVPVTGTYKVDLLGLGGAALQRTNPNTNLLEDMNPIYNSSQITLGKQYQIYSTGNTNWTGMGATSNTTGVVFKANNILAGTGTCFDPFDNINNRLVEGNYQVTLLTRPYIPKANAYNYTEVGRYKLPGFPYGDHNNSQGSPYKPMTGSMVSGTWTEGWHILKIVISVPEQVWSFSRYGGIGSGAITGQVSDRTKTGNKVNPVKTHSSTTNIRQNLVPWDNYINGNSKTWMVATGLNFSQGDQIYATDLTSTATDQWNYYGEVLSYNSGTGQLNMVIRNIGYSMSGYGGFPVRDPASNVLIDGTTSSSWEIGHCIYMVAKAGRGYSSPNNITLLISPPDHPLGVQATAKVLELDGTGAITKVQITNSGSGYYWPSKIAIWDSAYTPNAEANAATIIAQPTGIYNTPAESNYKTMTIMGPNISMTDKIYTYATNQYGQILYDANNSPIVLDYLNNSIRSELSTIEITRLS